MDEYDNVGQQDESSQSSPHKQRSSIRSGKSLGQLTRKFIALLQSSDEGIVDLKEVIFFHAIGAIERAKKKHNRRAFHLW